MSKSDRSHLVKACIGWQRESFKTYGVARSAGLGTWPSNYERAGYQEMAARQSAEARTRLIQLIDAPAS
jgi:hypothetical protein